MRGLFKNSYYKLIASLRLFMILVLLLAVAVIIFNNRNDSLLIGFAGLGMVLLPFTATIGLGKQGIGKWEKYMLTLPIKRSSIIKNIFLTQFLSLLLGILSVGIVFALSFAIHGFLFYRWLDVYMIFSVAITLSLIISAIFFPVSYADSKGRTEAIGIISLILGIIVVMCLITATRMLIVKPTDMQLIGMCIGFLSVSGILYLISYFITKNIFSKKEF